jgi:hypothetical protein
VARAGSGDECELAKIDRDQPNLQLTLADAVGDDVVEPVAASALLLDIGPD